MKAVSCSLILGAAAVLAISSGPAVAADQKVDHPLNCVPLSPLRDRTSPIRQSS